MGSTGIQYLLVISVLLTTGLCQQQTVVVPNPITANQPFTVTCEANRVPAVPSNVTLISVVKILRKVSANATDVAVAIYASFNPPGVKNSLQQSFIPPGRRWTITFSGNTDAGGSPVGNRNTMKVELVVSDTRLEDVGIYSCHVDYYVPGEAKVFYADVFINVTFASASPKTDPAKAGKNDAMIIVGIVIGCAVLIVIIICCVLRHKRSKREQARSSVSREK